MLNEQLSAWCDGEQAESPVSASADEAGCQTVACEMAWLIGDVLRGDAALSPGFTARVMNALASEPVVLAPKKIVDAAPVRDRAVSWMPIAAAVSGVFVAGWMAVSVWSSDQSRVPVGAQVVSAQSAPLAIAVLPRGQSGDKAYLMAHQAAASRAPMADVAHYIRTVGDDQQGAGQ